MSPGTLDDQKRFDSTRWLPYAFGLGALAYFGMLQFYGVNLGEEGATVYLFYRTAQGQQPYVDFISGYTPGYFYFHAGLLHLFGEHLSAVRVPLVAVHSLNVLLLARVALGVVSGWWAATAALAYLTLLPVVETSECSFNVPYPAWYCISLFLAGWLVVRAAVNAPRWWRWLVAGLLAAVSFSFKPNSGLFQLAFCTIAAAAPLVRWKLTVGLVVAGGVLAGLAIVLRYHLLGVSGFVFFLPAVLASIAWLRGARTRLAEPPGQWASLVPSCAVLAGFLGGTLPWLAAWWRLLGTERVWREVFFVDTGYEQYFFIPYAWSWTKFALLALVAWGAWRLPAYVVATRYRWLGVAIPAAALAALASYALLAPKPEGWQAAVVSAVQAQLYLLLPFSHFVLALGGLVFGQGATEKRNRHLSLVLLGATCLFCSAYPRMDFFHVAYAAPLSFVALAAVAEMFVQRWSALLPVQARWGLNRSLVMLVAALLVVCAVPQLRTWAAVVRFFGGDRQTLEWWDTERAAVLIRRDASGQRQANFARAARWLEARGAAGQLLFTFPDLDLLGFLVGTSHPARIGYFKSGWPNHRVEAEVIDALEQRSPRFVVTESPASLFFLDAPAYFFLLKGWIERHYRLAERVGSFRIWARNDAPWVAPENEHRFVAATATVPEVLPRACDRQALRRLRYGQDASAVAPWVQAWAASGLSTWELGCSRVLLRVAGEIGDTTIGGTLAMRRLTRDSLLYDDWAGALWNLALRNVLLEFQVGGGVEDSASARTGLDPATLLSWYREEHDVRVSLYLAWLIAHTREDLALTAALEAFSAGESPSRALERAVILSSLHGGGTHWTALVPEIPSMPSLLPALFLRWAERNPDAAVEVVELALRDASASVRELVAYLAVALGRCALCENLQDTASNDSRDEVRWAAQWARKTLGCEQRCTSAAVSG